MAEVPGEMVLQRPSVKALVGTFGGGVLDYLNNAHRWAKRTTDAGEDKGAVILRRKTGGMVIHRTQQFIGPPTPSPMCGP